MLNANVGKADRATRSVTGDFKEKEAKKEAELFFNSSPNEKEMDKDD